MSSRRLKYSIGFNRTDDICAAILALPEEVWQVAYDADRQPRDGAWIAELTGMLDLSSWPKGMRVIVGKERPHPGAQLRFTDIDGHRFARRWEPKRLYALTERFTQAIDLGINQRNAP